MRKQAIYLLISASVIILFSCKETSIEYINVKYIPENISPLLPMHCDMLDGDWDVIKNSVITDTDVLSEFEKEYAKLIMQKDTIPLDIRIKLIIHYKNKNIDTLCTGKYFGIFKNGSSIKNDEYFIDFIKKSINYE